MGCNCGKRGCGCNHQDSTTGSILSQNARGITYPIAPKVTTVYVNDRVLKDAYCLRSPSLHKKKYPGVSFWNGMLRFENMDALRYVTEQLEREIEQVDNLDLQENDESDFISDEPVLELFEFSLGFQSLRKVLEIQEKRWLERGGEPEDAPDSFIDDDVLLAYLNPNYEMMIGNSIFIFWNEDILLEIPDADQRTLQLARFRDKSLFQQTNVVIHDIGEGDSANRNDRLTNGSSRQQVRGCDELEADFSFSVDNFNQKLFSFNYSGTDPDDCNIARFEWDIYGTDGVTIIKSETGVRSFQYEFPAQGLYQVCLKITAKCVDGTCSRTVCKPVSPQIFDPTTCCKRRQSEKGTKTSSNGERKIKWKASFRNIVIWHAIIAVTKHYKKNRRGKWRKRKADFVFAGFEGYYYERVGTNNCGQRVPPMPMPPLPDNPPLQQPTNWQGKLNKRRMRTVLRVWDFPNIHMKEKSMMYQFETRDGGSSSNNFHQIKLATCD